MADNFHALKIRPAVGAEDRRHVTLEYLSGCTPDGPDSDFYRDYLQISGYVPLRYQPLLRAAPDLLKALKLLSRQTAFAEAGGMKTIRFKVKTEDMKRINALIASVSS